MPPFHPRHVLSDRARIFRLLCLIVTKRFDELALHSLHEGLGLVNTRGSDNTTPQRTPCAYTTESATSHAASKVNMESGTQEGHMGRVTNHLHLRQVPRNGFRLSNCVVPMSGETSHRLWVLLVALEILSSKVM